MKNSLDPFDIKHWTIFKFRIHGDMEDFIDYLEGHLKAEKCSMPMTVSYDGICEFTIWDDNPKKVKTIKLLVGDWNREEDPFARKINTIINKLTKTR